MTNAELLAKIKAEIERLKEIGGIVPLDNREQKTGYESALIDVETFLDTLESETTYDAQQYTPRPSVSIEDVARVQFASHAKVFDKKRKAVFDWEQFKEVVGIFYGFGKKNSLPEEKPSEDLEEAADNHIRQVVDAAGHPGWDWTTQDVVDAFIAGARWQKAKDDEETADLMFIAALDAGQRARESSEQLPRYYGD